MKKEVTDILHVYTGTSGSAGLYMREIYLALKEKYNQEIMVSYYYPFKHGKKIFYKFSDLSSPFSKFFGKSKIRLFLRFAELVGALMYILLYLLTHKVRILNYNLIQDLKVEYWFLSIVKKITKIKIIITCHDVNPFGSSFISKDKHLKRKQEFFSLADYLLIHNDNSEKDLLSIYNIDNKKIIKSPFPIMDLNKLDLDSKNINNFNLKEQTPKLRVGMFGHLRKEKGLDILLKAWDMFYSVDKDVELIIAGNIPEGTNYDFTLIENKTSIVYKNFLLDSEYKHLISLCDVVVFPYIKGTNSGIPSSVLTMGTFVLSSDIEMFCNNKLILKDFMFSSNNHKELVKKLEWLYCMNKETLKQYSDINKKLIFDFQNDFKENVTNCIDTVLSNN